jgi:hypothetical protein
MSEPSQQPLAGPIQWPTIRIEGSKLFRMFSSVIDVSLSMVNGPSTAETAIVSEIELSRISKANIVFINCAKAF